MDLAYRTGGIDMLNKLYEQYDKYESLRHWSGKRVEHGPVVEWRDKQWIIFGLHKCVGEAMPYGVGLYPANKPASWNLMDDPLASGMVEWLYGPRVNDIIFKTCPMEV